MPAPTALPLRTVFASLARPVAYFGSVLLAAAGAWRFRRKDFARACMEASAQAVPIVAVVNLLVGAILAFGGAVQLIKFGAGIFVADLVGIAVTREMAAVITAVVMAGRTGAAFAAELASMQTNEEIDALEVLGIKPVEFLVLPRVMALVIMMPLLYVYACAMGLVGGLLVASGMLDLPPAAYVERTLAALEWSHLGLGMSKSLVFGALIALTGCYQGLYAERSAAGVGLATTRAVVAGIVGVIALDAVFALCANALDI